MSLKFSTGLRNYLAVTDSLRAALSTLVMKIYDGTEPATADAGLGGATLLCTITVDDDGSTPLGWETTANDGTLLKDSSQSWEGEYVEDGTPRFFRLETLADAGGSSTSAIRVQGNIRLAGGDLNLSSLTATNGTPQVIDHGAIAIPAQ
jgi:hypothetical protein